jgi:hypothetical protein
VQFAEKGSFVAKKEGHREPGDAPQWGDAGDHTAVDPEHRLLLAVVPGKRTLENCQRIVDAVKQQTAGRTGVLLTSDEHGPYATASEEAYHPLVPVAKRPGPGRPPKPKRVLPAELCYATVCKKREHGKLFGWKGGLTAGSTWKICRKSAIGSGPIPRLLNHPRRSPLYRQERSDPMASLTANSASPAVTAASVSRAPQLEVARKLIAEPGPFRPERLKGRLPA